MRGEIGVETHVLLLPCHISVEFTHLFYLKENRTALDNQQLVSFIQENLDNLKAKDIQIFKLSSSSVTDYMIICSGTSKKHVQSIAENLSIEAKNGGEPALGIEGMAEGEWVLVDLGNAVVHVMQDATRDFYQLEKLWSQDSFE